MHRKQHLKEYQVVSTQPCTRRSLLACLYIRRFPRLLLGEYDGRWPDACGHLLADGLIYGDRPRAAVQKPRLSSNVVPPLLCALILPANGGKRCLHGSRRLLCAPKPRHHRHYAGPLSGPWSSSHVAHRCPASRHCRQSRKRAITCRRCCNVYTCQRSFFCALLRAIHAAHDSTVTQIGSMASAPVATSTVNRSSLAL